ncbi:hypothetical protein B0H10DRAFT_1942446 [Mycena sp. CBHHK59/15]|nr:hypothetical protein B0H10DRAFT_1942446 [Mycena sp. CBHHK59/15]
MAHALLLLDPAAVCQLWVPATQLPGLLDPCTGAAPSAGSPGIHHLRVLGSSHPHHACIGCGLPQPAMPGAAIAISNYPPYTRLQVVGSSDPRRTACGLRDPIWHGPLLPTAPAAAAVGSSYPHRRLQVVGSCNTALTLGSWILQSMPCGLWVTGSCNPPYWSATGTTPSAGRGAVLSVMQCLNCALKESPQTHLKRCACGLFYCVDRDGQTFVVRHISERLRKHLDRNVGLYSKAGLAMLYEEYPAQALTSIVVEDSDIGHTFATMRAEHSSTGQPNLYILCQAHYSTDGYAGVVNVYKHIVFPTDDLLPTTTAIQALVDKLTV